MSTRTRQLQPTSGGTLVVVDDPENWPFPVSGVAVLSAREYLVDPRFSKGRGVSLFNLCRSYAYQTLGYYVSLLATTRDHKPVPSVSATQEMKSTTIVRLGSEELAALAQDSFESTTSNAAVLHAYFGRSADERHSRLADHLFRQFEAPFLRGHFVRDEERWKLRRVRPIAIDEIPVADRSIAFEAGRDCFAGRRMLAPKRAHPRYTMAIPHDPHQSPDLSPSDAGALERFVTAAAALGISAETIERDDLGRIAEFDALLIRETTAVNHHTFRFTQRAGAEGLVVVGDPRSILRCTNKMYLARRRTGADSPRRRR